MPFSHETGPVTIGELRHVGKPPEVKVAMRLPNRRGAVAALPEPGLSVTLALHEADMVSIPA
jgi:hypothetical protein